MSGKRISSASLGRRDLLKCGLYGGLATSLSPYLWLSGCSKRQKAKMPNIIVLTVDTLRADHMALYGYSRNTMPAIEKFAKTAVVFDNPVVPRGSTRPSYASMLTGLYPFRHGVYNNTSGLHESLTRLPQLLKSAGYHTAAFMSNFSMIKELSGCQYGFDIYDDLVEEREANRSSYQRTAMNTLKAILKWLGSNHQKPFFLFTNFIDPHGPYQPPERFRNMYRSKEKRIVDRKKIPPYQFVYDSLDFYDYQDRYDGEISYTDEALGMLIAELKKKKLWDDALIVFTADHGEHLGDHTDIIRKLLFNHAPSAWDATARVPMVIRLPETLTDNSAVSRRVRSVCSPMDLAPTVLDYLGIDSDVRMDGLSLLPVLKGQQKTERVVLLECPLKSYSFIPKGAESYPDIYAIRSGTHKLVRGLKRGTSDVSLQVVFDISADPLEKNPLRYNDELALHHKLAKQMDVMLQQVSTYKMPFQVTRYSIPQSKRPGFIEERTKSAQENIKYLSEEQIESLRSLGYVE
ncbi:MAG: sulfatase [Planctomycetota bacterium]